MEKIKDLLNNLVENQSIIYGVISNLKKKDLVEYRKVTLKPVKIKNDIFIQFTYHIDKKVKHTNLSTQDAKQEIMRLMMDLFKQTVLFTTDADYQIFSNKKRDFKVIKKSPTRNQIDLSHNKRKNYIIQENVPCPFLIKLGVMNEKGNVYKNKYNKFKQINRYLEIVSDVITVFDSSQEISIVDFGCGKSYLTFALYHYLINTLGYKARIIGLDLKKDVIDTCNELAEDLDYRELEFIQGDIKSYDKLKKVDMVITLHACDTATDDAIVKAVEWDAEVILSVPCCQHEFLNKIHNPVMKPMEKHGIIKEKLSSLITDSVRANILEILGYSTQVMEFIDMEHTPKNILIRGVKKAEDNTRVMKEYLDFKEFWGVDPYLENALGKKLSDILEK